MNRAQRRAKQKAKPVQRRNISQAMDEFQQFDDIDRVMQKLEHGAIEMERGRPVMTTKGEAYDVVAALEGWLEYWAAVATKRGIPYDDEPMRIMKRRLDNGVHLTSDIIHGAKRVVADQRALFRAIPRHEISSDAITTQIKIAMEDCGIIAP